MDKRKEFNRKRNEFYNILKEKSDGCCFNCGEKEQDISFHVHHIVPLASGGTNHILNLALLCVTCHGKVHQKDMLKMSELSKKARMKDKNEPLPEEETILPWMLQYLLNKNGTFDELVQEIEAKYYISQKDRKRLNRYLRFSKKTFWKTIFFTGTASDWKRYLEGDYQFIYEHQDGYYYPNEIPESILK